MKRLILLLFLLIVSKGYSQIFDFIGSSHLKIKSSMLDYSNFKLVHERNNGKLIDLDYSSATKEDWGYVTFIIASEMDVCVSVLQSKPMTDLNECLITFNNNLVKNGNYEWLDQNGDVSYTIILPKDNRDEIPTFYIKIKLLLK